MFRDVPMRRARGDFEGAERSKSTSLTFILLVSAIAATVGALCVVTVVEPSRRPQYAELGVLSFLTLVKSHYVTVFKAESRFRQLSISAATGSVVSVATVALIFLWGLDGLIGGMIAQATVELFMLARHDSGVKLGIDFADLRQSMAVGALTLGASLATTLITTVDRTVMLDRLGGTATGAYYLGANLVTLLPTVAGLPATVLTPRFFERYGATGDGQQLVSLVERPVRAGSVAFAAVITAGAVAIPPVVGSLWPNLVEGNTAARLALLATYPLVLSGLVTNVFYAMNRQVVQLVITLAGGAIAYVLANAFVGVHATIAAVVTGSVVGLWLYYLGVIFAAFRAMVGHPGRALPVVAQTLAPAVVGVALVVIVDVGTMMLAPHEPWVRCVLGELSVVTVFGPWVILAGRRLRSGG
jgi:O-antigen/teichoic acid export membrane protein